MICGVKKINEGVPVLAIKDKTFEYRSYMTMAECGKSLNVSVKEISNISLNAKYTCSKGWTFIRGTNLDIPLEIRNFKERRRKMDISVLPDKRVCDICKIEKPLNATYFHKHKSTSKYAKFWFKSSCKECRKGTHVADYLKSKNKREMNGGEMAKYIHSVYRKLDLKYKRHFSLSIEWIKDNIVNATCFYCKFPSNGIDRISNDIGHVIDNCIPCCTECNCARMDNFTHEEFKKIGVIINEIKTKRNAS